MTAEQIKLVEDNIHLVNHVLSQCGWKFLGFQEYDDLFQIGCIGLMNAAKSFDPSKGMKFSTLACKVIRRDIYKTIQSPLKRDKLYHATYDLSLEQKVNLDERSKANVSLRRCDIIPDRHDSIRDIEFQIDLDRALQTLTKDLQDTYLLRIVQGLTLDEIAQVLGITRMAVSYRLQRLGRLLRAAGVLP